MRASSLKTTRRSATSFSKEKKVNLRAFDEPASFDALNSEEFLK